MTRVPTPRKEPLELLWDAEVEDKLNQRRPKGRQALPLPALEPLYIRDIAERKQTTRSVYKAKIVSMTKAQAAEREFADFIELVPGVGAHGRYVLKNSGIPVLQIHDLMVEGMNNQEIVETVGSVTAEDVGKTRRFINALI